MRIDILTLFPEMFHNVLGESMLKIAREKELVSFHLHNIRDYSNSTFSILFCIRKRHRSGLS